MPPARPMRGLGHADSLGGELTTPAANCFMMSRGCTKLLDVPMRPLLLVVLDLLLGEACIHSSPGVDNICDGKTR